MVDRQGQGKVASFFFITRTFFNIFNTRMRHISKRRSTRRKALNPDTGTIYILSVASCSLLFYII